MLIRLPALLSRCNTELEATDREQGLSKLGALEPYSHLTSRVGFQMDSAHGRTSRLA